MKLIFWILLALFLLFLFLTIQTKRKKGEIKLKYLFPAVLFLVPCVLLASISQEYTDKLFESIYKGRNVGNNLISFLYHVFF